jgi:hypothetical protein
MFPMQTINFKYCKHGSTRFVGTWSGQQEGGSSYRIILGQILILPRKLHRTCFCRRNLWKIAPRRFGPPWNPAKSLINQRSLIFWRTLCHGSEQTERQSNADWTYDPSLTHRFPRHICKARALHFARAPHNTHVICRNSGIQIDKQAKSILWGNHKADSRAAAES